MSIKIGLTGNYLSDIDSIANIFRRYKVPVYDCDLVIKYLLYNSEEHIERVIKAIGNDYFRNGILDITGLSGTDKSGVSLFFKILNTLKYDIIKSFELWRKKYSENKTPYVIFKSQILFEYGFNENMNLSINTYRPIKERVEILKSVNNMEYIDSYTLLENEMDERLKNNMSSYTVYNFSGYGTSVEEQISTIHKSIKGKCYVDSGSQAEYI